MNRNKERMKIGKWEKEKSHSVGIHSYSIVRMKVKKSFSCH
ncbi:MAG: hypothetical protein WAR79_02090 [Melioribacteraceae bacterium]